MDDKKKLEPMLRMFKNDKIDIEYAIDYILSVYSQSKRFNYNSFIIGCFVGATILYIFIFNKL